MKLGKICLILILFHFPLFAQTLQSASSQGIVREEKQTVKAVTNSENRRQKQSNSLRQLSFFKQKINKEQQKLIAPDKEDLARYSAFLQQPKTGIIRLTDDIGCEPSRYIIRADEECLKSIPGSSFYSFREREYSSSALADIRLKDGLLITDGVFSQNILVKLGDLPLENISINSDGLGFLTEFQPETDSKHATNQYIRLTRGIKYGKFEYLKVFPAFENTTYAMRLVAYRVKVARVYRGYVFNPLSDERSDVTLVFRIIRKERGGITLLWKELERKKSPKLVNSERKS